MNEFLQEQLSIESRSTGLFRPFEAEGSKAMESKIDDIAAKMNDLSTFNIKAASLNDTKSQNLYKKLNPAYCVPGEEESKKKGGKKGTKLQVTGGCKPAFCKEEKKGEGSEEASKRSKIFQELAGSLSTRL